MLIEVKSGVIVTPDSLKLIKSAICHTVGSIVVTGRKYTMDPRIGSWCFETINNGFALKMVKGFFEGQEFFYLVGVIDEEEDHMFDAILGGLREINKDYNSWERDWLKDRMK